MQREQKKIVMEEKIHEWLNMKKEQVDNCWFKLIIVLTLAKSGQFNCELSYFLIDLPLLK